MSEGRASESGEETNVETAMAAVDGPCGVTSMTTRLLGEVYPLNSSRLATDVVKRIVVQLGLPGSASRADTTNGGRPDSGAGT